MNMHKINTAITDVKHPWIKRVIQRLKIVDAQGKTRTMATDGKHIFVDAEYLEKTATIHVTGILVHEALHVIMRHPLRRGERDPRRFNVACDHAINAIVITLGYRLPDNVLQGRVGSAEQIYGKIEKEFQREKEKREKEKREKEQEEQRKAEKAERSSESTEGSESESGEPADGGDESGESGESDTDSGESETDAMGKTSDGDSEPSSESTEGSGSEGEPQGEPDGSPGDAYDEDGSDVLDYPMEEGMSQGDAEREVDTLLAGAAMDAVGDGNGMSEEERNLLKGVDTGLNWPTELEEWLQDKGGAEYSMNPPHIGLMSQGIICNQLNPTGAGNVVLAVDVSGSIDKPKLRLVITHLMLFVENIDYESLRIITCDSSVRFDETYFRGEPVDWDDLVARGITGGGTAVAPVFKRLQDEGFTPDLMIYFSDMKIGRVEHRQWNEEPGFPMCWLVDNRHALSESGDWIEPEDSADMSWRMHGWVPPFGIAINAHK